MARITVEDCVEKIPNKFQLVLLAARRAYEISSGSPVLIDRDNDKDPVVALREIAMGKLSISDLEDSLIRSMKKNIDKDKLDDESFMDFIRQEQKDTSTNSSSNKRVDSSEMIFEDIDFNSLSE